MDEAVFLIVLGAFAILYAVGWLVIGLPKRERRGMLKALSQKRSLRGEPVG
jgi:hypothetical protein